MAVKLANLIKEKNTSDSKTSFNTTSPANLDKVNIEPLDSHHTIDENLKTNTGDLTESETIIEEKPKPKPTQNRNNRNRNRNNQNRTRDGQNNRGRQNNRKTDENKPETRKTTGSSAALPRWGFHSDTTAS